jgi:hypothetical protein
MANGTAVDRARSWNGISTHDLAALVLILVLGAFVSAASMTGPVMMWMHLWHARLGSMLPVTTMYYAAGQLLVPAVLLREATYHYILALVPLGFSMWFAHLFYHLLTGWSNVIPSWPPSVQVLGLDLGFLLTLYLVWRRASIHGRRGALAPWVTLAIALYSFGVWILFQPMDMR